ncbi:Fur family transcriptional regulator [Promicromonospora sp. NPDC060271]|uniref:Fur family transcriptional regulator n=1 Tax=Promicromonospora sp. NPDC060271 TaxID=3347089 RepID=UPI00365B5FB7
MSEPARTRRSSPRSLVERELTMSDRFRTANAIHLALADRKQRVSLSTVYRTLTALAESGSVEVVHLPTTGQAYRLRPSKAAGPYLVCRGCGTAATVPAVDLAPWFRAVAARQGFSDIEPRVELWGRCTGCRQSVDENDSHF